MHGRGGSGYTGQAGQRHGADERASIELRHDSMLLALAHPTIDAVVRGSLLLSSAGVGTLYEEEGRRRRGGIVTNDTGAALNGWRKRLLATVGAAAIAGPVAVGLVNVPPIRAQSPALEISSTPFASASVRANTSTDPRPYPMTIEPDGRFAVKNTPVQMLIRNVYGSLPISGGPGWFRTDRFPIP